MGVGRGIQASDAMTERTSLIHYARVLIAQSRHFTARHRGFSFTLLEWAGRARRRVMEDRASATVQFDLFGGPSA